MLRESFHRLFLSTLSYVWAETAMLQRSTQRANMYLALLMQRLFFGFIKIVRRIVGISKDLVT